MTFREKLQQEHPECIRETVAGGCMGCPCDYQYENPISCDQDEVCKRCWDREIPDNEQPPKFGEWISVKERLPEFDERVLTYRGRSGIYLEIKTLLNFSYDSLFDLVEFWMPLPEAPEVEE